MSITYTPTTNFGAKDSLPANDPAKVIKGTEFTTEFTAIQSAFALAAPAASPTFTGTATFDDVSVTNGLTVDTDTLVVDDTNNNVGIGTSAPVAPLHVKPATDVNFGVDDSGSDLVLFSFNDLNQTAAVPMNLQANSFKFSGSSDFVSITSSGDVGIGTDSPVSPLTVSTSDTSTAFAGNILARLQSEASGRSATLQFSNNVDASAAIGLVGTSLGFGIGSTERMRITSTGDVGIGTSSPGADLHVAKTGGSSIWITDTGTRTWSIGNDSTSLAFTDESAAAERMRIDPSGNVGIGTTSPSSDSLSVEKGSIRIRNATGFLNFSDAGSDATEMYIQRTTSGQRMSIVSAGPSSNGFITFATGGASERMRIDSSGNLLVGQTSAFSGSGTTIAGNGNLSNATASGVASSLNLAGIVGVSNGFQITTNSSNQHEYTFLNGAATAAKIDSSGNLLVGKTSLVDVDVGFQVESSGRVSSTMASSTNATSTLNVYSAGAAAYRFYVTLDGQIRATQTSILGISDASLKENVRDLDKGLDTIMALQPRRFDWKNGDGTDVMGFIAQEVEPVMPELVADYQYNDDEVKKGLKMGDMIPAMVKAMQEQQAMIEDLKAEVEALKNA